MKHVWSLKRLDWNDQREEYVERYTSLHQSSRKARRAAIEYITVHKAEKDLETYEYHKGFYTLTSESKNTHCIISKSFVD